MLSPAAERHTHTWALWVAHEPPVHLSASFPFVVPVAPVLIYHLTQLFPNQLLAPSLTPFLAFGTSPGCHSLHRH